MTTRTKTIEFATTVDATNLAAATNRDKTVTIYIPETVVAFRSVTMFCTFRQDDTAAASLGNLVGDISHNGSSFTTLESGIPIPNSGENQSYTYAGDATSAFTTNWTGTSMTWTCRINAPTITTINHWFMVRITYTYDDTATTHIKTIRIPIESTADFSTGSWVALGGATAIPALADAGSYLPEASVVLRQAFVVLSGNEAGGSATDFVLEARVNGGTAFTIWDCEQAMAAAGLCYTAFDITADVTSAAIALETRVQPTASRFATLGGYIVVTYEFAPGSTTTVYNSLLIGGPYQAGRPGVVATPTIEDIEVWIQETGTITMKESAWYATAVAASLVSAYVRVGAQATVTQYPFGVNAANVGGSSFVHRLDSAGQQGTDAVTLARGRNTFTFDYYIGSSAQGHGINGVMILNYTSGLHADGIGAHAQSRFHNIFEWSADIAVREVTGWAAQIAEADYFLVGAVADVMLASDNSLNFHDVLGAARAAGEGSEAGYRVSRALTFRNDNENHHYSVWLDILEMLKRWPNDPGYDRLDVETARKWQWSHGVNTNVVGGLWLTYHAITYAVAGTISDSGAGTVNLELHADTDQALLDSTSRSGDGAYSFTWYDDTEDVYVVAFEDDTHMGRTVPDPAV